MKKIIYLGIALLTVQVSQKASSELYTHATEVELSGSRALLSRLGEDGYVEKQYATITFKKRTNDDALLTILGLHWNGPQFTEPLSASLFRLDGNGEFLPTEEYLISETKLNNNGELRFRIAKPIELLGTTTFALVLRVSDNLEKTVHQGNFSFVKELLPAAFQSASQEVVAFTPQSIQNSKRS